MEAVTSPMRTSDPSQPEPFEQCEQCGAAVAREQRYCVECGAHRRYVPDPAVRYLRSRSGRPRPVGGGPAPLRRSGPPSLALAVLIAVVPVAVALGVLLGRSSTSGDGKLIAALRAQRPEVLSAGTSASASPGLPTQTASAAPLTSTFPLQSGWAVELQTLPGSGTSRSTVAAAESAARSKGASAIGLIVLSGFRVTPKPAGPYVIYSGAYHSRAAGEKALSRLLRHFSHAAVIHVQAVGASASAAGGGKALSTTGFGTAHQIVGSKPTTTQLAAGRQVVQHIQQTQGKSYVNAQRGLPDQIAIP